MRGCGGILSFYGMTAANALEASSEFAGIDRDPLSGINRHRTIDSQPSKNRLEIRWRLLAPGCRPVRYRESGFGIFSLCPILEAQRRASGPRRRRPSLLLHAKQRCDRRHRRTIRFDVLFHACFRAAVPDWATGRGGAWAEPLRAAEHTRAMPIGSMEQWSIRASVMCYFL